MICLNIMSFRTLALKHVTCLRLICEVIIVIKILNGRDTIKYTSLKLFPLLIFVVSMLNIMATELVKYSVKF